MLFPTLLAEKHGCVVPFFLEIGFGSMNIGFRLPPQTLTSVLIRNDWNKGLKKIARLVLG